MRKVLQVILNCGDLGLHNSTILADVDDGNVVLVGASWDNDEQQNVLPLIIPRAQEKIKELFRTMSGVQDVTDWDPGAA